MCINHLALETLSTFCHFFVAWFITPNHFFAALLRVRLVGPSNMKGVFRRASITFLLNVFFRLLAIIITSIYLQLILILQFCPVRLSIPREIEHRDR